ncbi:MAG: hypothetical protein DMG80_18890 [Acidobacteria bacterium]|nr:MAG: hypothetical protein DMG80_18890 [Acidobacteriota bacterium]
MTRQAIRFRNSWFIRAGTAIAGISAVPLALVGLTSLFSRKEIGVGPTGIWFLLGASLGSLFVVLGFFGVIFQRSRAARERK